MATEKTEFEILLRDNMSPALQEIERQLRALVRVTVQGQTRADETIMRFRRQQSALGSAAGSMLRNIEGLSRFLIGFGRGLLGAGLGIEAVRAFAVSLKNMAVERVQLTTMSRDTKIAADNIEKLRDAMKLMGLTIGQANTNIIALSGTVRQVQTFKEGSQFFQQLSAMGPAGVNLARTLIDETDVFEGVKRILEFFKAQGPDQQLYLSSILRVPEAVLNDLLAKMAEVKSHPGVDPKIAEQFLRKQEQLMGKLDSEWKLFGSHVMEGINRWFDVLNQAGGGDHALSKSAIKIFDAFDTVLKWQYQRALTVLDIYKFVVKVLEEDRLNPAKAKQSMTRAFDPFFGRNRPSDMKDMKQEENKLLKDIGDALRQMIQRPDITSGGSPSLIPDMPPDTTPKAPQQPSDPASKTQQSAPETIRRFNPKQSELPQGTSGDTEFGGRLRTAALVGMPQEEDQPPTGNETSSVRWSPASMEVLKEAEEAAAEWRPPLARGLLGALYHGLRFLKREQTATEHPLRDWLREKLGIKEDAELDRNTIDRLNAEWMTIIGERDAQRGVVDRDRSDVFTKGTASIQFNFNNVPPGVRTNAEASGSFTEVQVSRKSAMQERAE